MNFIFPYVGNNHPNWRTHIFQRGGSSTNQLSKWSVLRITLSTAKVPRADPGSVPWFLCPDSGWDLHRCPPGWGSVSRRTGSFLGTLWKLYQVVGNSLIYIYINNYIYIYISIYIYMYIYMQWFYIIHPSQVLVVGNSLGGHSRAMFFDCYGIAMAWRSDQLPKSLGNADVVLLDSIVHSYSQLLVDDNNNNNSNNNK